MKKDRSGENNGFYGKCHVPATIEILKEKNGGINNGFYGKKHTEEAKKIMSELAKKRFLEKGSPLVGRTRSEETKLKISLAKNGVKVGKRKNPKAKTISCDYCGKELLRYPSGIHERNYCSIQCAIKVNAEKLKKEKVYILCEECGISFFKKPYEIKRNKSNYCSPSCGYIGRSKKYQGEKHWGTGKSLSLEIRKKMGASKVGDKHYLWGKRLKRETREKISKANSGENSGKWKGGITSIHSKVRKTIEYTDWRNSVYARDGYLCQVCGRNSGKLNAHHHMPFAKYPELRFDVDNGITLGNDCHKLVHRLDFKHSGWGA